MKAATKRAKGRAAKRQPLPRPQLSWNFDDGPMGAELAEVVMHHIEGNAVITASAQAVLEQRFEPQAGEAPRLAWLRWAREKRLATQRLAEARIQRAKLLDELRKFIGHAQRDLVRGGKSADTRRRAGRITRESFAKALLQVHAEKLPVTAANLKAKWPPGGRRPSDTTIRELMEEPHGI